MQSEASTSVEESWTEEKDQGKKMAFSAPEPNCCWEVGALKSTGVIKLSEEKSGRELGIYQANLTGQVEKLQNM